MSGTPCESALHLRADLATIFAAVEPGTRVLDIGCGDGVLLAALRDKKEVDARGLEIDPLLVERCVARGLSVVQGDAVRDLPDYPDGGFDYAVLSQTLQTVERPDLLLRELLRVGRQAFVSFPNFAHWRIRRALALKGRMPVTSALPASWYATRDIHHVTVADFEELAARLALTVEARHFFAQGRAIGRAGANWRAEFAMYRLRATS
jgi:methionine biosynthesis protein MetW